MVVPVHLGCCPDAPRCVLCPPPPQPPTPDLVEALIYRYGQDHPGAPLELRFFGGAPPPNALLDAAADVPTSIRVRPDLLSRERARQLRDRGVRAVELDALSFDDATLRESGRRYRGALLHEMAKGLDALGFEVGGVLAPGLPRSSHHTAIADAHAASLRWRFARIHPVLVLHRSALRDLHDHKQYVPLTLGEAITTCRAMMDVLEAAGVTVTRVGLQPGPDGFGRAVAGPRHSALRQLVEARRTLDVLREHLQGVPPGADVTIACAPADETRTRGPHNQHLRTLRAEARLGGLRVITDPRLPRGQVEVDTHIPLEEPS